MVRFVKTFLATVVLLVLLFAALPLFLQVLDVPAFTVGDGPFLLLSWRNDVNGTGIHVSLLPLCLLALAVGLVAYALNRQYPQ